MAIPLEKGFSAIPLPLKEFFSRNIVLIILFEQLYVKYVLGKELFMIFMSILSHETHVTYSIGVSI